MSCNVNYFRSINYGYDNTNIFIHENLNAHDNEKHLYSHDIGVDLVLPVFLPHVSEKYYMWTSCTILHCSKIFFPADGINKRF